jgi:eukaryotic-like serine/threonine-protein kinase
MSFLGFLFRKKFYIHLGISIILTVVLLLAVVISLRVYTRHGDAYVVPNLEGKTLNQMHENKASRVFKFQVTDSVYDNSLVPGSVIKQNPSAGSKAKEGRTIYLTTVSYTPKMSIMPELKDLTVRQAITTLRTSGLKIRKLIFTPYFAGNSVIGQYYNGDTLLAGTKILEGSEIDLLAGLGENQRSRVPFVLGLTLEEATTSLQIASFNDGMKHYIDGPNPIHSRVYRQSPEWNTPMFPGDSISLYLRSDLAYNFDSLLRLNNPDTAVINNQPIDTIENSDELLDE